MPALQKRFASEAVRKQQDFFRLFQALESGGDIFEIDESASALAVGPQSDLSSYRIDYFDEQATDNIEEMSLAVDNPIVGPVFARNATPYPRTQLPDGTGLNARIIVSPRDLVDNEFFPSAFGTNEDDFVAARPQPRIDLLCYFQNPGLLAPLRDDLEFEFPFLDLTAQAGANTPFDAYYILPYYGRRYGFVNIRNLNIGETQVYTAEVIGINLTPGKFIAGIPPKLNSRAGETPLGVISAPKPSTANLVFGDREGLFDLIVIRLSVVTNEFDPRSSMRVTFSDRKQ